MPCFQHSPATGRHLGSNLQLKQFFVAILSSKLSRERAGPGLTPLHMLGATFTARPLYAWPVRDEALTDQVRRGDRRLNYFVAVPIWPAPVVFVLLVDVLFQVDAQESGQIENSNHCVGKFLW